MEKINCENCNGNSFSDLYKESEFILRNGEKANLVKCNNCSLICINPRPNNQEILTYYEEDYYGVDNIRFRGIVEKLIHLKRIIRTKRIFKIIKQGKILDIGCGRGIFLEQMEKCGWEIYGTEISEVAAKCAKKKINAKIYIGSLKEQNFPENYFDVITLYHVMEHLPHPAITLKEIYRILKPKGLLVISVPNIKSWQARVFKRKWFHLDIPRHYFHFDYESMNKLLETSKWEVLKTKRLSVEHDPFGWIQSSLNAVFNKENILYDILKSKAAGSLMSYASTFKLFRWSIIISNVLLGTIIFLPALILSFISSATNHNAIIEIYYQKKSLNTSQTIRCQRSSLTNLYI